MVEKFIADVEENFERLRDFLDNKCESCVALLELANIYQTTRPIIFPDFEEIRMETVQLTLDDIRHLTTGYDDLSEEKQDEIITKLCKTLTRQYTPFPLSI